MASIKNWQPEILEDNILKIVPLKESDFNNLFEVASDPKIWEQHPTKDRYKKDIFRLYFDGAIKSKTAFLIINKSNNKIIGSTRYYDYKPENSSIAIGYTFLSKENWGGQFNKSSKRLLTEYAFQFIDKIYFHIASTNIRSQFAILKIGASKIGEVDFDYYGKKLLHFEYLLEKNIDVNFNNENYDLLAFYTLGLQDKCFTHQYVVDAHTAQSANSSTKAISLTFALVGLYLFIEKGFTGKEVQEFHTLMSKNKIIWPNFELPENRGEITIDMVLKAEIGEERKKMIKVWCGSIWKAFYKCHREIKELTKNYINTKMKTMNR
jgi:RimJ/RimL family protein N-acetyltransferase